MLEGEGLDLRPASLLCLCEINYRHVHMSGRASDPVSSMRTHDRSMVGLCYDLSLVQYERM